MGEDVGGWGRMGGDGGHGGLGCFRPLNKLKKTTSPRPPARPPERSRTLPCRPLHQSLIGDPISRIITPGKVRLDPLRLLKQEARVITCSSFLGE